MKLSGPRLELRTKLEEQRAGQRAAGPGIMLTGEKGGSWVTGGGSLDLAIGNLRDLGVDGEGKDNEGDGGAHF